MTREERHQCYNRIYQIVHTCNYPDWNGYAADVITKDVASRALEALYVQSYQPFIVPTLRNSIQFEFDNEDLNLHIEFEINDNAYREIPYAIYDANGLVKASFVRSGKAMDAIVREELHKRGGEKYDNQY